MKMYLKNVYEKIIDFFKKLGFKVNTLVNLKFGLRSVLLIFIVIISIIFMNSSDNVSNIVEKDNVVEESNVVQNNTELSSVQEGNSVLDSSGEVVENKTENLKSQVEFDTQNLEEVVRYSILERESESLGELEERVTVEKITDRNEVTAEKAVQVEIVTYNDVNTQTEPVASRNEEIQVCANTIECGVQLEPVIMKDTSVNAITEHLDQEVCAGDGNIAEDKVEVAVIETIGADKKKDYNVLITYKDVVLDTREVESQSVSSGNDIALKWII